MFANPDHRPQSPGHQRLPDQLEKKMIPMLEPMLSEFREEAATTKRVLERVPADKLSWKPHPKSMSLGQLAMHVASIPGNLSKLVLLEEFDVSRAKFDPPAPGNVKEIHATFDQSVRSAEDCLNGMSQETAVGDWRMTARGKEVMRQPRTGLLRSVMLNHWYHHRGQLSVYLRLLDVPVPVIYGRSADENPFA
jgi:uncharacterized damage-inducible protein DinB